MELWTIGYEKASSADFLRSLRAAGIEQVCDVRERPQSRRAGFSKRQLAAALEAVDIGYTHFKALGTPPEGRLAHRSRDLDAFWAIYERQLGTAEARAALDELCQLIARQRSCLVCYEADWRVCHRARIVEELSASVQLQVHHLLVEPVFL